VANGLYGLVLSSLFVILQAPDVALSMLVVGSIAYPLIVLIAVARVRSREREGAGG
jgi:energy-converting hydrogenase B subunit D